MTDINHSRMLIVLRDMVRRGFILRTFLLDENGVMHRLDRVTANPLCRAFISDKTGVLFNKYTTCLQCMWLGG